MFLKKINEDVVIKKEFDVHARGPAAASSYSAAAVVEDDHSIVCNACT